jgi:hypothetical protein
MSYDLSKLRLGEKIFAQNLIQQQLFVMPSAANLAIACAGQRSIAWESDSHFDSLSRNDLRGNGWMAGVAADSGLLGGGTVEDIWGNG